MQPGAFCGVFLLGGTDEELLAATLIVLSSYPGIQ